MKETSAINTLCAFLLSVVSVALLFGILAQSLQWIPIVFAVAGAHLLLALPMYFLLKKIGRINFLTCSIGGFFVGLLPIAFFTWPQQSPGSSASSGGVALLVDGVPTAAGWLSYIEGALNFGVFGLLAGGVFWLILKFGPGVREGRGSIIPKYGLISCASLLVVAIISIPGVSKDRSCHNNLRDGRSSIGPQVGIDLDISNDQWPAIQTLLETFAVQNDLSFRDSSDVKPDVVRTLYLSMCSESGFSISTSEQRWASNNYRPALEGRGVGISVYEVREGSGWRQHTLELINRLEERWPGQVRYRDGGGYLVPMPDNLYMRDELERNRESGVTRP